MAAAHALPQIEESPIVREISSRMAALRVGQAFIAEYNGFSQAEMSRILSGVRIPDVYRVSQIKKTLDDLEALNKIFSPGRLVWDVPSIKIFVRELVRKPEAGKALENSFARFRDEVFAGMKK